MLRNNNQLKSTLNVPASENKKGLISWVTEPHITSQNEQQKATIDLEMAVVHENQPKTVVNLFHSLDLESAGLPDT